MGDDSQKTLFEKLKLWEDQTNSLGFGLAIDRQGHLYSVHYAGMGNLHFEPVTSKNTYFKEIQAMIESQELEQQEFKAAAELGELEVAQLKLV